MLGILAFISAGSYSALAQTAVPIRTLGPAIAHSAQLFRTITSFRVMSDGRVLISDFAGRQVVLLDSSLAEIARVADSAGMAPIRYPGRPLVLIPFAADSTLIVDESAASLLVIDPTGRVARAMAGAASQLGLMNGPETTVDHHGRLIFRGAARSLREPAVQSATTRTAPVPSDSVPLVRWDFVTRALDTVAMLRSSRTIRITTTQPDGTVLQSGGIANPLPVVDDFVVISDGSMAVLRAGDYHFDWIDSGGARSSTAKMAFDWRRLTDEDKRQLIDSINSARAVRAEAARQAARQGTGRVPSAQALAALAAPTGLTLSDFPDYYPSIRAGAQRADAEGNVWVLPLTSAQAKGGLLYDVVNRQGVIVRRVQLPAHRILLGLTGDAIFLGAVDSGGTVIERIPAR